MNAARTPRIVHGTPVTPAHLLDELAGGSFCVVARNHNRTRGHVGHVAAMAARIEGKVAASAAGQPTRCGYATSNFDDSPAVAPAQEVAA